MAEAVSKKNSSFVSVLRIFAALAVVVIHTRSLANHETLGYNLVYAMLLWSVPVFFMMTGYIFLGIKKCVEYKDIKKNVFRFLAVLVVLGMFFSLSERVFTAGTFQFKMLGDAISDVIQGNLFDHMWYLYEIIGLYLLLPVFSAFLKNNEKNLYIFIALLFGVNFLIPELFSLLDMKFAVDLSIGKYALYLFLGAAMHRMSDRLVQRLFVPSVLTLALIFVGQAVTSFVFDEMIELSYVRSYVVVMSCCVFCIFRHLFDKERFDTKFIRELAGCTWGIYLFHPYVIHIFGKLFKISIVSYNNWIAFPICCAVVFTASAVGTFVLRKIPVIKRFL